MLAIGRTTGKDLVNPITAELVVPTVENAALLLSTIDVIKGKIRDLERECSEILIEESERIGKGTLHIDGVGSFRVSERREIEWDLDSLAELKDLGLAKERYDELVEQTVETRVRKQVANEIAATSPRYKEVIDRSHHYVPGRKRVEPIK